MRKRSRLTKEDLRAAQAAGEMIRKNVYLSPKTVLKMMKIRRLTGKLEATQIREALERYFISLGLGKVRK